MKLTPYAIYKRGFNQNYIRMAIDDSLDMLIEVFTADHETRGN